MQQDQHLDNLYNFIGQYVLAFQYIEGELDKILLLVIGHDRWHVGQCIIAKLSNRDKIDAVLSIVSSSEIALKNGEWIKKFETLISRVKKEGERRNKILHSQYIYDLFEASAPPLRSKLKTTKKGIAFDREYLDSSTTDVILKEIFDLAVEMSLAHVQLVHWSDDLSSER